MALKKIIRLYEKGSVQVDGLRGCGKDMLTANVVVRRNLPYISNVNYGGQWMPFDPKLLDCNNSWRNFISGTLKRYVYPYEDGIDIYISDAGIYFPSQYQGELCKEFGYIPVFLALQRQLGDSNTHTNTQTFRRCWDKLREQSDIYLHCCWCKVLFGKIVIQKVVEYELYESAERHVPPFRLSRPLLNPARIQQWEIQKSNYDIAYGKVTPHLLIYWNRSNYNTRIFKEILSNA